MYRFAPTTTDDLDIDSLRVALFNYICAKQSGGMFIVRMEDSDQGKNINSKDSEILDILAIFGITYDNLYYQSENFKYHLQFASSLMDKKKAFACFCADKDLKSEIYSGKCLHISEDELLNNNLPFTIRIKKPEDSIIIKDTIQGKISFSSDEVDSFVIMKQDKYPTYNFACAIDDMIQGVKNIIRTKKHLSNTPKQEHIRKAIGYSDEIKFTHLPVFSDTIKIKSLLDQGFMPESIINYLILLGNETPTEIFSLSDAISWFDIEKISSHSVKFDIEKLSFINREQIKLIENVELSKRIGYSCAAIGQLAKLYTEIVSTTAEIKAKIDTIFTAKSSQKYENELNILKEIVKNAPYFDEYREFKNYLQQKSGFSEKKLLNLIRILLTKEENGPDLEKIYPLIKNYLQEIAK